MCHCNSALFTAIFDPGCDDGGMYRSVVNGQYWDIANSGLIFSDIRSLAVFNNALIAGSHEGGVWVTSNSGDQWASFSTGFTDSGALALAVSDSFIFAGSESGRVWRRPVSDLETAAFRFTSHVRAETFRSHCLLSVTRGRAEATYSVQSPCFVDLTVFSMSGQRIFTLVSGRYVTGIYRSHFEATSSGMYGYRFIAGTRVECGHFAVP
jgi:hypothetical protein